MTQKDNGLDPDGIVGAKTWKALNDATVKIQYYTVTIPHLTQEEADKLISSHKGAYKEIEKG